MRQPEVELSDQEIEAARSEQFLIIPAESGIIRGARFSMRVKVGGRMQMVTVMCKGSPFEKLLKGGRTAKYVKVFGYGVAGEVNIKKLRARQAKEVAQRG